VGFRLRCQVGLKDVLFGYEHTPVLTIRRSRESGNPRLARDVGSRVLGSLFTRTQWRVGLGRSFVTKVESIRLTSCVVFERSR
jgi:hypothetical protein